MRREPLGLARRWIAGHLLVADEARSGQLRRAASLLAQDEELKKKKRALASLVVHDLRSPLSGALSYLDLIAEETDPVRQRMLATDARELVARALSLVATILDVDELEDGVLRATPQQTPLARLISEAWTTALAGTAVRDIRFECAVPAALDVELDPELFERVIENLFDNAIRYAPRGGRVAATATVAGGTLEVAVGNDGPPVPEGERDAIFGRYHQIEARRASARANRGLGLYFCKLAIEAHGGTIVVDERDGLPTTFVVRIHQPLVLPPRLEDSGRIRRPSDPNLAPTRASEPVIDRSRTTTGEVPPIPRPKPSTPTGET
jgi:two-component system, OmpR family, heavy metal sensor histidine kinase CusS